MAKKIQRWPIWKIAVSAAVLALAAAGLFVLSGYVTDPASAEEGTSPGPVLTMPTFLVMLGAALSLLSLLSLLWLVLRIREARLPVWERNERRRRRRRR